jgi:hypothetical protein
MITIPHTLKFITEVDETHPVGKQLANLPAHEQIELLESMLKSLVAPALAPVLADINANGSYAILKVAE